MENICIFLSIFLHLSPLVFLLFTHAGGSAILPVCAGALFCFFRFWNGVPPAISIGLRYRIAIVYVQSTDVFIFVGLG